jgi:hypothetical protein
VSAQNIIMTIRTPDGLRLSGSFVLPEGVRQGVVLVHGGGVMREEGGFFTRLAAGLADAGIAVISVRQSRSYAPGLASIVSPCLVPALLAASAATTPLGTRMNWPAW